MNETMYLKVTDIVMLHPFYWPLCSLSRQQFAEPCPVGNPSTRAANRSLQGLVWPRDRRENRRLVREAGCWKAIL
jgi:hypothetical protein